MYGIIFFLSCFISTNGLPDSRIIGGEDANPNEFPFIISLRRIGGNHNCGGSILNAQWILTAAHCLTAPADQLEIVAGEHNRATSDNTEQVRRVDATFQHPEFINVTFGNDVALLRLATDLQLNTFVQAVNLEPEGYVKGNDATIIGWGRISSTNLFNLPNILQKATVTLISNQECRTFFPFVTDTMMCAGAENRGICQGDSGGPLICSSACGMVSLQCGIVSFSATPCDEPGVPEGFTRVTPFLEFIRNIIDANSRPARLAEL